MKIIVAGLALICVLSSCVTQGAYDELAESKLRMQDSLGNIIDGLRDRVARLEGDTLALGMSLRDMESQLADLRKNYSDLRSSSASDMQTLIDKLEKTRADLRQRERRLNEVESKLAARDSTLKALFNRLNTALLGFKESGLSVAIKNGKVYVSLSNQLLFKSGRTDIDKQGQDALLELANVLNANPDIDILVEGHTDNQAVRGGGRFSDNWDLSVLRSTEVIRYLTEGGGVAAARITAAGRSEYVPIEAGDNPEARAVNRRTEIILTPDLDELFQLISN